MLPIGPTYYKTIMRLINITSADKESFKYSVLLYT